MSADISGRVLDLEKQVVGLPGRYDYDNLNTSISSRFNVVGDYIEELQRQFIDLNNKIINLQLVGNTARLEQGIIAMFGMRFLLEILTDQIALLHYLVHRFRQVAYSYSRMVWHKELDPEMTILLQAI